MKKKDEKAGIKKELKKKKKTLIDYGWILTVTVTAFVISFLFSFVSEITIPKVNIIIGCIVLLLVIILGIFFDIIGVAVQAADEKPFHSMNSRRVKGAAMAIKFKKNTDKVSSFCNDVIGDICGIISGSTGSVIALSLATSLHVPKFFVVLGVTSLISALTIGGKAIGKSIAINQSNQILYAFAKTISLFKKS